MDSTTIQDSRSTGPATELVNGEPTGKDYCDCCDLGPSSARFIGHSYVKIEMEEYEDSAKHGCQACANILKFFDAGQQQAKRLSVSPGEKAHFTQPCDFFGRPGRPYTEYNPAKRPHVTVTFDGNIDSDHEFFIMDHTSTETEQKSFKKQTPSLIHPVMEVLKRPSGDTSSEKAFSTLEKWLSKCQTEHTMCNSWSGGTLPHRVLEIHSVQPLCVRVVEDCSQQEKYACLSYRWGPETKSKSLNKGNLDDYKAGIPEDRLYPLVKDAITATDRLGLRYIWIDSYCILQDDRRDWETEAAKVASVYKNAFVTFCATFSEDGWNMFSTSTPESLGAQITDRRSESIFVRKRLGNPSGITLDRAWVFQERLLSNRVIYFSKHEVAWECRERSCCECGSCMDDFSNWLRGRPEVPKAFQQLKWEDIAKAYDSKMLSNEKDRLPALAGVARRHGESSGKTYLAGLWKEEIPSALLWERLDHSGARPLHRVAPTWSWASLPRGQLFFWGRPLTSVRLLGYNRSPLDGDIYTATGKTEITVEGPMLDVRIYQQGQLLTNEGPKLIGNTENAFLTLTPDFDMKPEDPTKYQDVSDGTLCSLLLLYIRI